MEVLKERQPLEMLCGAPSSLEETFPSASSAVISTEKGRKGCSIKGFQDKLWENAQSGRRKRKENILAVDSHLNCFYWHPVGLGFFLPLPQTDWAKAWKRKVSLFFLTKKVSIDTTLKCSWRHKGSCCCVWSQEDRKGSFMGFLRISWCQNCSA